MQPKEKEFLTRIERHKGMLRKVARLYMENNEDAKDLFQEIILQLWKSHRHFREQSEWSTWMYRVALNTAMTFVKKETRRKQVESSVSYREINEVWLPDDAPGNMDKLYMAAAKLNAVEKALLVLWLEGLNYEIIAKQLGITEGTARVRLSRIKEKLQQIIIKK